jgi:4-carboxymuconolactone decarboxylase
MTRIQPAPAKGVFRKYVYRAARKRFDRDLEPVGVMGHHTRLLLAMGGYELPMEKADKVDARLKSLGEIKVALLVGCEFCIDIGTHVGGSHGISDEKLLALPRHREASCFNELERLVIDYAEAMTRTPAAVTDDLFAGLREHFDDEQLVELTAAFAWENWRARFNWAFDIGAAGFTEGAACPIPVREEQATSVADAV